MRPIEYFIFDKPINSFTSEKSLFSIDISNGQHFGHLGWVVFFIFPNNNALLFIWKKSVEQLVLECYWTTRLKKKMTNNMYRFSCINCKESHKNKNTTSLTRYSSFVTCIKARRHWRCTRLQTRASKARNKGLVSHMENATHPRCPL